MQRRIWTPLGQTEQTKKGLHIKVQEGCKALYEPHGDKQNKQRKDFTIAYKKYAKGENMSPTGTNRTNKETKGLPQSTCKVLKFKKKWQCEMRFTRRTIWNAILTADMKTWNLTLLYLLYLLKKDTSTLLLLLLLFLLKKDTSTLLLHRAVRSCHHYNTRPKQEPYFIYSTDDPFVFKVPSKNPTLIISMLDKCNWHFIYIFMFFLP